jgi:RNA polymerase sigma-70 factor (ECF subfamily)
MESTALASKATVQDVLNASEDILRFAQSILGNTDDAEDAAQDSTQAAIEGLASFRGASKLTTWLYKIVERRCSRIERTSTRAEAAVERYKIFMAIYGTGGCRDEGPARPEGLPAIVEGLPAPIAEAVKLYYLEGLTYDQIAQQTGVSNATAFRRVAEGLVLLREILRNVD